MSIIRVLVADNSLVFRSLIRDVLDSQSGIEVVAACSNGKQAVKEAARINPDVIVLDVEMPVLNGIEALREILAHNAHARVVMFSAFTTEGAELTLDALESGAKGFAAKPATGSPMQNAAAIEQELVPLIRSLTEETRHSSADLAQPRSRRTTGGIELQPAFAEAIGIAISTGGPRALQELLPALPADFPAPILIVQHMPPVFTQQLATRLNKISKIDVVEATEGLVLRPGLALIAPGDIHLEVKRSADGQVLAHVHQQERENNCRPSADPLFRSLAQVYGEHVCALVMTGMGSDGAQGCEAIKQAFGSVIAQDLESSVVWGMPGAVVERGLADAVLPLDEIPAMLCKIVAKEK